MMCLTIFHLSFERLRRWRNRARIMSQYSQHMNNRKQRKVDISKQRHRKREEKFPCQGQIRFIVVSKEGSVGQSNWVIQ